LIWQQVEVDAHERKPCAKAFGGRHHLLETLGAGMIEWMLWNCLPNEGLAYPIG